MPLFFQLQIDEHTQLAVWKIEEEEAFFLKKVPLQRAITHPHKRLQHLAGRYLLQYLFPEFPIDLIKIADTRKPFLEDEAFHFSISHCAHFAAAIVSKEKRVGVDIEVVSTKIEKVQHKFSSIEEMKCINVSWLHQKETFTTENTSTIHATQLTFLWSCKEAIFKWFGAGGVAFKENILLQKIKQNETDLIQSTFCFKKEAETTLRLQSYFFEDAVLSYVIT